MSEEWKEEQTKRWEGTKEQGREKWREARMWSKVGIKSRKGGGKRGEREGRWM